MRCWACRKREAVPEAAFCDPCLEAFEAGALTNEANRPSSGPSN